MNTTNTQSQKRRIPKKYKLKIVKSLIFTDYELRCINLIKCWAKLGFQTRKGKFRECALKSFQEDWVKLQKHFIDEYEVKEMVKKNKEAERKIEEYVKSL